MKFRIQQKLRIARELVALARNGSKVRLRSWNQFWNVANVSDPALRHALGATNPSSGELLLAGYLFGREKLSFYFSRGESEEIVHSYRRLFPGRIEQIVEEAEGLCAHRFGIFAYKEVKCGARIPWRKDLVHGTESGLHHWSRIPFLDFAKAGDSKIVWEPNRHQHLVTLALAYRLTGDERYAQEALAQWEDWQCQNPHLRGINWASSLELAFRVWSWIWMMHLLAGSRAMTGARLAELTRALALHADFITANLSTYFSPNTHLLGEGFALFVIGLVFPELRRAEIWREKGRRILLEEITKQVREDGSHAEQSTCYHRYATDFFLCAAILADKNGCSFLASYRTQLKRMVEFMLHTAWPDRSHPMIGDADGGRLLPFGVRRPNDNRTTLSTAAVYFGRKDFRDRAGAFHEETLWLLGPDAAAGFATLVPKAPHETSKTFPKSGFAVMRSGWQAGANMLLLDAGPQGMDSCGHGHADALSVVCSAEGTNWLVDPGTFVYTASREWRDYFRSTRAHNTLVVDGQGQVEPLDTFKWDRVCHARLGRSVHLPHLDFACGVHEGYARLPEPVVHRRCVVFAKPEHWLILDVLAGTGKHTLEFLFHFAPEIQLQVKEQWCWAAKGSTRFLVLPDSDMSLEITAGAERPLQGWFSEDYGHRESAPVLTGRTDRQCPAWVAWALWPEAPSGTRLRALSDSPGTWVLENDNQIEYFFFSDAARAPANDGEISTDADFAFVRQDKNGFVQQITVLSGSHVRFRGGTLFTAAGKVEEFDLARHDDSVDVQMRSVQPFTAAVGPVAFVRLNGRNTAFQADKNAICIGERS